ncbi:MAG TPA: cytochrome D1 domain-containing protein [Vineibacter sp.]|nr:cytochrome D1 domain-containing protein [Vineibacter sp.]
MNGSLPRRCLAAALVVVGIVLAGPSLAVPELVVVLNSDEASLSVVDRRTGKEFDRRPIGREPHHLMLTPDGKELVVGSTVTNELTFLDPVSGELRRRIRDILDPYQLGFSPDGKWFVTAAYRMNHVDIYDAADYRLIKRLPLATLPSHMAFTADSAMVLVTMQGSNQVTAIALAKQEVAWTIDVGEAPAGIYVTPDQRRAIVGLTGEDAVAVIDLSSRRVAKWVVTGRGAHNIFRMPDDPAKVLVTNRVDGSISILDTTKLEVLETFRAPGGPDCLDFTPDGKQVWVTQRWRRKVMAIDLATKQILNIVNVGRSPHGVYINGPHTVSRSVAAPPVPTDKTAFSPSSPTAPKGSGPQSR